MVERSIIEQKFYVIAVWRVHHHVGIVERVSRNFAPLGAGFALWAENNLKTRGVSNWLIGSDMTFL
jgi:hypothetical protein